MHDFSLVLRHSSEAEMLYGNGPPQWTQGKHDRQLSKTAQEAEQDRQLLLRRLRRPRFNTPETELLAKTLESCRYHSRCASGACPLCARAFQRLWVTHVAEFLSSEDREYSVMSIVPSVGRFKLPSTRSNIFRRMREAIDQACDDAGIDTLIGGFDPGINEHVNGSFRAHGQIQLWGFAPRELVSRGQKILRDTFPAKGINRRPIRITKVISGSTKGIAYALKPDFVRRESLPRIRGDEGEILNRRNTRNRGLRVSQQCELALALDRAGLDARLFIRGIELRGGMFGVRMVSDTVALEARASPRREHSRQPP